MNNLLIAAVMLASPVIVAADLTAAAIVELARGGITSECMVKIVKLAGAKLQFSLREPVTNEEK